MSVEQRKCVISTAQIWFDESRKAQMAGRMRDALLYMENAFNHTENALASLLREARNFPRATLGPGDCTTIHNFPIDAGTVWGLDRVLKLIDGEPRSDRGSAT